MASMVLRSTCAYMMGSNKTFGSLFVCTSFSPAFYSPLPHQCCCHGDDDDAISCSCISCCSHTLWSSTRASQFNSSLLQPPFHARKRARKSGHVVTVSPGLLVRPVSTGSIGFRVAAAKLQDEKQQEVGAAEITGIAGGLIAVPVVAWSLYTLKTTGCGLPPGPGGAIGGLEGVSYLVIVGLTGWSIYTKVKTGSGLPSGPFGLLGAVEGLSYLTIVGILVVFGLQYLDYGYIPGPVPGEQCFG